MLIYKRGSYTVTRWRNRKLISSRRYSVHLTVELTAVELHADGGFVVPVYGMEPNEASNHRREEGVSLRHGGFLVPREHLVKEEDMFIERSR